MAERENLVLPLIRKLPKKARDDILLLLTRAPGDLQAVTRHVLMDLEFEQPIPSRH
jgi:hypothetical protein